jgi:riboflavin synthase
VVATDAHPGDSIAVNGTCLTATRLDDQGFVVGVMPETVRRTNLARLAPGDTVNLERALQPTSRLGGILYRVTLTGWERLPRWPRTGRHWQCIW